MKSAFLAPLFWKYVWHNMDEEHLTWTSGWFSPTHKWIGILIKIKIYPCSFFLICFQSIGSIKSNRKHVPFYPKKKKTVNLSLILIVRWLSTLLDILWKYLDKNTNSRLMQSADDTKLGNAVFIINDSGSGSQTQEQHGWEGMGAVEKVTFVRKAKEAMKN